MRKEFTSDSNYFLTMYSERNLHKWGKIFSRVNIFLRSCNIIVLLEWALESTQESTLEPTVESTDSWAKFWVDSSSRAGIYVVRSITQHQYIYFHQYTSILSFTTNSCILNNWYGDSGGTATFHFIKQI